MPTNVAGEWAPTNMARGPLDCDDDWRRRNRIRVVITVDRDGGVTIDHDSPIFRSTSPANSALRSTSSATETANGDGVYDVEREWDGDRGMTLAIESKSETVVWLAGATLGPR